MYKTKDQVEALEERLSELKAERRGITKNVQRERRDEFTELETSEFREVSAEIKEVEARLAEVKEDRQRRSELHNAAASFENRGEGATVDISRRWAQDAANALHKMSGETRAVISGSVDVPIEVALSPMQFGTPFPQRLIDVLPNRLDLPSMAFEYYQQTARVNNAAPVADLGQKPVSQFTVELVNGTAYYIATLTQPAPIRIWWDFQTLVDWLQIQAIGSVWDAVEQQVISGNGTGINQTGILHTAGTTNIGASADLPTTLRSARTAMQNLGEEPTAWCLNPIDAELLDLTRWGSSGGFLSGGYQYDSGNGFGTSDNILGPSNKISRVITPHVPAGTALLANFKELALFMRHSIRIDVATQGNPTGTQDLFGTNAFVIRAEVPVGVGVLRPQSFAVISLPGGS